MWLAAVLVSILVGVLLPAGKPVHTDKSPSGSILAQHFVLEKVPHGVLIRKQQIWLRDAQGKSPPMLLFEHQRNAEVLFSPDEKWIAINDNRLSDESDVRLFQKSDGLKYREIKNAEAGKKCWHLFDRGTRRSISDKFDHRYMNAVRWAPDSRAVLLVAQGYLSEDVRNLHADDWQCVFSIDDLTASTDTKLMSRVTSRKAKMAR